MEKSQEIRGIVEIWRCRRKRLELKTRLGGQPLAESPDLPGSPLSPCVLKRNLCDLCVLCVSAVK